MKALIANHKKELEQYTDLDMQAIENVTYLHEFDREVQYVPPQLVFMFHD